MYRVKNSKYAMLGGVCAGLSHSTNMALWVVRLLVLLCIVFQPWALLIYLGLWAFLPTRYMSDQEFKAEAISFRDIPSVKAEIVLDAEELEKDDSTKVSKPTKSNVFKNIEDEIIKNTSSKNN